VELKRRTHSGNACYHSVQKLLSSRLLSKNLEIRIHKTAFLLLFCVVHETWCLILRECGKSAQKIFGLKRVEKTWDRRGLHNEKYHTFWRMLSFRMLRRVALVRTDDSEEHIASIIRVTRIGELRTLAVTNNQGSILLNTMYAFLCSVTHRFLSPWWRRYSFPKRWFL
jgi:hypothetical protein